MPSGSALTLPAGDRTKLVAVLGTLGSDQVGERAAAGLLATRLLRARGLTWDQVVGHQVATPQVEPRDQWRRDIDVALRHLGQLAEWPSIFAIGLSKQRKLPTLEQRAKVAEIAAGLRARGFA